MAFNWRHRQFCFGTLLLNKFCVFCYHPPSIIAFDYADGVFEQIEAFVSGSKYARVWRRNAVALYSNNSRSPFPNLGLKTAPKAFALAAAVSQPSFAVHVR